MDRHVILLGSELFKSQKLSDILQELGFSVEHQVAPKLTEAHLVFLQTNPLEQDLLTASCRDLWPSVPIILVTSESITQEQLSLYDGVLEDPWSISDLLVLVQPYLALDPGIHSETQLGDWIDFSLTSSKGIFHSMRDFLRLLLLHSRLNPEQLNHIHFAICEILINAMEHGNQFDPRKRVKGSYVFFQDKLVVKIEDQGCGFLMNEVLDPIEHPFEVAEKRKHQGKRPGGYGLALARKWMELTYNERGNVALLSKAF